MVTGDIATERLQHVLSKLLNIDLDVVTGDIATERLQLIAKQPAAGGPVRGNRGYRD